MKVKLALALIVALAGVLVWTTNVRARRREAVAVLDAGRTPIARSDQRAPSKTPRRLLDLRPAVRMQKIETKSNAFERAAFAPDAAATGMIDVAALHGTRVFELLRTCFDADTSARELEEIKNVFGAHPFDLVERAAFAEDLAIFEGRLTRADFTAVDPGATREQYGDESELWKLGARSVGRWRDRIVVFGGETQVRAALDRLEGRAEPGAGISEEERYGDAQAIIGATFATRLLGLGALGEPLEAAGIAIKVHLDAADDLRIGATITAPSLLRETIAEQLKKRLVEEGPPAVIERAVEVSGEGVEVWMRIPPEEIDAQKQTCQSRLSARSEPPL
jgi:hypothetical protein